MGKDYYQVLGLERDATLDDIKKSYRKLAKQYHPDINKEKGAEERFKEINEAYEVLSDPQKKSNYDRFGSTFENAQGASGFEASANPFDIFNSFFSQNEDEDGFFSAFRGSNIRGGKRSSSKVTKKEITITFLQSIKGCEHELSYKSNQVCRECKGNKAYQGDTSYIYNCSVCRGYGYELMRTKSLFGIVESKIQCRYCDGTGEKITKECSSCRKLGYISEYKKTTIKIPGGVKDGDSLLLKDSHSYDDQKIYIHLKVEGSNIFTRDGDNLYTKAIINPLILITGGNIEVPTPYGLKTIKVPAGSKSGELLKLKSMGISMGKKGIGNLYIKLETAALKLSPSEIEKIKSIASIELKETREWLKQFQKEYGNS